MMEKTEEEINRINEGRNCVLLLAFCEKDKPRSVYDAEKWLQNNAYSWPYVSKNVVRPRLTKFSKDGYLKAHERKKGNTGLPRIPYSITEAGVNHLLQTIRSFCDVHHPGRVDLVLAESCIYRDMIRLGNPLNSLMGSNNGGYELERALVSKRLEELIRFLDFYNAFGVRMEQHFTAGFERQMLTAEIIWLQSVELKLKCQIKQP